MKRIISLLSAATVAVLAVTGLIALPASAAAGDTYTSYVTYASAPKEIIGKTSWGMQKLTAEEAATVPISSITARAAQFMRSSTDNSLYKVVYETVTPITELTWKYEGYPTPRIVTRPPAMEYYTYASYPSEMIVRTPLGVWRKAKVSEYTSVPDERIVHRTGTYFIRNVGSPQIYKKSGGITVPITDGQWRGEGSPTPMVPETAAVGSNVFAGHNPYRDPTYPSVAAAKALRLAGRTADAAQVDKISAYAGSLWIGEWDSGAATTQIVADYAQKAIDTGQTGVLVVYAIPGRACTGYSAGGYSFSEYKPWIDQIAAGIAGRRLSVIIEPDALLQLGRCTSLEGDRMGYLRYAASTLTAAGGSVYLDAGSSNFGEPASVMADRLTQAGIAGVRGFSVNVANHKWVGESRVYADELSRLLGGKKYVIDTSRNGRGSNGGEWCNSRGRALGSKPEAVTYKNQDANLWVKTIGASDGTCNGGPTAGKWWDEIAIELATNSVHTASSTTAAAMTTEWNVGSPSCATITVPVHGTVNALINWGDGTSEPVPAAGYPSHTYADPTGHYTVTVEGTFTEWGGASGWNPTCITQVTRWGDTSTVSAAHGFERATNLTDIAEFSPTITDMSYLLAGNTTFAENVDAWDLSKVTNLSHMFDGATGFNRPVSMWNVGSATNLREMFAGATSFNQPIGGWNTAAVTDFSAMFKGATAFSQPIGLWNTGNARTFASMFEGATKFNQPLKTWNTARVTNLSHMFDGATAFTQTLSTWDTSQVTTMASMLRGAVTFNQPIGNWNTARVTDMSGMFDGAKSQNQGLGAWNTAGVTTMNSMFRGATAYNRAMGSWDTARVTDMTSMFERTPAFNQPINGWTVGKVTVYTNFRSGSALSAGNTPAFR